MKKRSRCGQTKPLEDFVRSSRRANGRGSHCRECHNKWHQERPKVDHVPLAIGAKQCAKCGETKPLTDFNVSRRRPDGRQHWCRVCSSAYGRATHAKNPRLYAETRRAWQLANPDKMAQYVQRWRDADPERARQASKRSNRNLRETQPHYHRDWYRQNIEKGRAAARESMRAFRKANPNRDKEIRRRYRKNNAEAVARRERENTYARRARQPYSKELATFMADLVLQPCAYCSATEDITIDHVVPLSRGGKHEASNLASCCRSCNSSKCDRLLSEWPGRL